VYTNIYTHRHYRPRRREIAHQDRRKFASSIEQRHRLAKLSSSGMDASHIAHQLGINRKVVRNLLAFHHYGSLPKSLEKAFIKAAPQVRSGPLFVVFDRAEWQPSESSVAAAGNCTTRMAA
jgi:hypothetical protein